MKNMRSFSLVVLSAALLLSSAPVVALEEGPAFDFDGAKKAGSELFSKVSAKAKEGFEAAKGMYHDNAPKVVAAGERLAESVKSEFNNLKDGVTNALNKSTDAVVAAPAVTVTQVAITAAPQTKAGFSIKNFFAQAVSSLKNNGSQLKETVKAHSVITGAILAAVIAVPLVIYGLKKAKKANLAQKAAEYLPTSNTAKSAAIVGGMIASVAIPVAIAAYNNDPAPVQA